MTEADRPDQHELALLESFARRLRAGGSGTLILSELLPREPAEWKRALVAIWRLSDRGWLVVTPSTKPLDQQECRLVGEGLRRAMTVSFVE